MNLKMTKSERNWVLYDVGNSAFTMLIATIMPIYFNYLAEDPKTLKRIQNLIIFQINNYILLSGLGLVLLQIIYFP